ncbi:hypothetical protein B9Z19DRAFT_1136756 [Tuber borchii]|uniref:Uncharacterized protein n=1 Tax=Tuber borchii TaxID=42251 RepID=A0A2T6ZB93_TUBBO|nr:hypothetical protein B9Z19DRAFT_1136756 [Tuber borchii]
MSTMEQLYEELWVNRSQVIKYLTEDILQPDYWNPVGMQTTLPGQDTRERGFPPPPLKMFERQIVAIQRVKSRVPVGKRIIMARMEYRRIMQKIKWVEKRPVTMEDKFGQRILRDYLVTGHPGCGKSMFLTYVLIYRLLEREPTVYRRNDSRCYLFDERHRGVLVDSAFLFNMNERTKRHLWILTDAAITDPQEVEEPITNAQIVRLYTTYMCLGPTARVCLRSITINDNEDFYNTWEAYVGALDREIDALITSPDISIIKNASESLFLNKMLLIHPMSLSTEGDACISTRWIANRFLQIGLQYAPQKCFKLYQHLSYESPRSLATEWLFKAYGQYWLQSGGRFVAEWLPALSKPRQLLVFNLDRFKYHPSYYFTSAAALAEQVIDHYTEELVPNLFRKYFIPYGRNYSSFDALSFMSADTIVLFEITQEKDYEIQPQDIQDLGLHFSRLIKNIHIVYIIPADRRQDYSKVRTIPQASEIRAVTQQLTIRQFRLAMADHQMQELAFPSSSVPEGETL